jgi:hypothetical protein
MVAGAALVSSPIIIHLINRMRFRRIRWAAMEFLLKAQKRMRRKLIIEQLILLFLRCLLVFLVGMLVARFKWFSPLQHQDVRETVHVVVLDDTPSMADVGGAAGDQKTAFDQGKMVVWDKIAPAALHSNTPQSMYVLRVSEPRRPPTSEEAEKRRQDREAKARLRASDPEDPKGHETDEDKETDVPNPTPFERLSSAQVEHLKGYLGDLQPSNVRGGLVRAIKAARVVLAEKAGADTQKVLHVVTDLRANDWAEEGEALKATFQDLARDNVRVHLIDAAQPNRRKTDRVPRASDNAAIVEFRPLARVAAQNQFVEFEVRVKNFGGAELNNVGLRFFLNGKGNVIPSREIDSLPPGQERRVVVPIQFTQVATPERPLDRFSVVTAALAFPENGGLAVDNYRHAVIEVEPQRRVLVVEGRKDLRELPEGDGYYLRKLFSGPLGGIKWEDGDVEDLVTRDLRQFSCVYLLNVRELTPPQVQRLENYVRDGGGLAVFVGPNVNAEYYNEALYKQGQGLFAVKLKSRHRSPGAVEKPDEASLPPEKREKLEEQRLRERRRNAQAKWILPRDPSVRTHPALAALYATERPQAGREPAIEEPFRYVTVKRYWPADRVAEWTRDPNVRELYCLANEEPATVYEGRAKDLIDRIERELENPRYQDYRKYFLSDRPVPGSPNATQPGILRRIRYASSDHNPDTGAPEQVHVAVLAQLLDELLRDTLTLGDEDEPKLKEFWATVDPKLRADAIQLRNEVRYGDPLYLARKFGDGRVVTVLTTAGSTWTDWPNGVGLVSWLPVMVEMYNYLSAGKPIENRVTGAPIVAGFDPVRKSATGEARVSRFLITADPTKPLPNGDIPFDLTDLDPQAVELREGSYQLAFTQTRTPGVYLFSFPTVVGKAGEAPGAQPGQYDCAAFAVNVDADHEGQLQRASYDDVVQQAPGVGDEDERIHSPDNAGWVDSLKQQRDDLSTRRWLYLLILLVLIAEQAMAVRLSHHARADDLELHAPTAAAALAKGGTQLPPPVEAPAEPAPV